MVLYKTILCFCIESSGPSGREVVRVWRAGIGKRPFCACPLPVNGKA